MQLWHKLSLIALPIAVLAVAALCNALWNRRRR
jgi:hypothetical protein